MKSLAACAVRRLVDQDNDNFVLGSPKRVQGRPSRGENEVGSHKIVEGMRAALRSQQSTNITRKDIAFHAGVTPALVTYYFPERNSLIEAATLPIAQALVGTIRACFENHAPTRQDLVKAIEILLDCYMRDAIAIELFNHHRASTPGCVLPDLSRELDELLETFFERWLGENPGSVYDAEFLRKGLIGACKSIARRRIEASGQDMACAPDRRDVAEMACCMFLGPTVAKEPKVIVLAGVVDTVD